MEVFMKLSISLLAAALLSAVSAGPARAHFGLIIPSAPLVSEAGAAGIKLDLRFWHPFENKGLDMAEPQKFQVWVHGRPEDLKPALREGRDLGFKTWSADYRLSRPGLHAFTLEQSPYWEAAEDKFIIHYPKAYVGAFGDDEGWAEPLPGLKTEIVPLVKPDALYAGNVFTGRVLLDGRPVPGAEVEVEWYPGPGLAGRAPSAAMIPQAVRADADGVFSYAAPRSGWWGLAALTEADYTLPQEGQDKAVELGAVLWLYFHDFPPAEPIK
jgi:cobalt/nickel transport protein